jgi:hypothetical protein
VAKRAKSESDVRCEACWLKLCLIGYKLDTPLYDKLRCVGVANHDGRRIGFGKCNLATDSNVKPLNKNLFY